MRKNAREALELVGFPEKYYKQSPFELSGRTEEACGDCGSVGYEAESTYFG